MFSGLGWHKALPTQPKLAKPRHDAARLTETAASGHSRPLPNLTLRPRLDHDKGLRPGVIVGQCHMDDRLVTLGRHLGQPLGGPSGDVHHRLPSPEIADRHVLPRDPHAQPGAERLGARLFRRPPLGIGPDHIGATLGLGLFDIGKDAVAEPVAEPFQRARDPIDIRKIGADAKDHPCPPGAKSGKLTPSAQARIRPSATPAETAPARAATHRPINPNIRKKSKITGAIMARKNSRSVSSSTASASERRNPTRAAMRCQSAAPRASTASPSMKGSAPPVSAAMITRRSGVGQKFAP